jgi:hypothetical protein
LETWKIHKTETFIFSVSGFMAIVAKGKAAATLTKTNVIPHAF